MQLKNIVEMTEKEVIETITSKHKFYAGVMPQSTASLFLKRWREGKAKQKTVIKFMEKFGYKPIREAEYINTNK